jgi:hypothetical protein
MENHEGRSEKSEVFNGIRLRKIKTCATKTRAVKYKKSLKEKGYAHVAVERENPQEYNVYGRKSR